MAVAAADHLGEEAGDPGGYGRVRGLAAQHAPLQVGGIEEVGSEKVRVALLPAGESRIELLEPTADDSPVARFLDKNGPGVHHVAYEVADLEQRLAALKAEGVRLIDEAPRTGAHNTRIAFMHPKASGGVLTELCEPGTH